MVPPRGGAFAVTTTSPCRPAACPPPLARNVYVRPGVSASFLIVRSASAKPSSAAAPRLSPPATHYHVTEHALAPVGQSRTSARSVTRSLGETKPADGPETTIDAFEARYAAPTKTLGPVAALTRIATVTDRPATLGSFATTTLKTYSLPDVNVAAGSVTVDAVGE